MNLGDKLKYLRKDKNLTMEELCNIFNEKYNATINKSMISRWEANKTTPLNTYLTYYAKYFNVTLDYLLDIHIDNPTNPEILYLNKTFTTAKEAMDFMLNQAVVMGFNGLDVTKLSEEEQIQYANDMLEMMKLVSLKYKGKK